MPHPLWPNDRRSATQTAALTYVLSFTKPCCHGSVMGHTQYDYLHGKGWECEQAAPVEGEDGTSVKMGVRFEADHAGTYWIFDNDVTSQSVPYGDPIPYPTGDAPDWAAWWALVDAQLNRAAEVAHANDCRTCSLCGGHYWISQDSSCPSCAE